MAEHGVSRSIVLIEHEMCGAIAKWAEDVARMTNRRTSDVIEEVVNALDVLCNQYDRRGD